ncbi:MAG: class I SAM-dependent methyltransferase [Terriglobales bacterium]
MLRDAQLVSEMFKRPVPPQPQKFTGERFTTEATGQIETEHYHRYFLAREYCRDKDVLDIASGEGYGSALLAQTARSVVGVEVDSRTVEHARRAYEGPKYLVGNATCIPIGDTSVDVVVSFETLEHFREHDAFLNEVRRVLRPGGLLIISTPDRDLYFPPNGVNEYHLKELTRAEFETLLKRYFVHAHVYLQRAMLGSALLPDGAISESTGPIVFEKRDDTYFEKTLGMPRAPYIIAFASDEAVSTPSATLYVERAEPYSYLSCMEETFRAAEAAFHEEEARLRDELARAKTSVDELRIREAELAGRLDQMGRSGVFRALSRILSRGR